MKSPSQLITKRVFLLIFVFTFNFLSFSQQTVLENCTEVSKSIEILKFQEDLIYGPGSNITVFINPTGFFELDNQFKLFLVDQSTNTETLLSTKNEFYIPILNGTIPADTNPGNYTLKITAQSINDEGSAFIEQSTNEFVISENSVTNSILSLPTSPSGVLSLQDFSKCLDYNNNNYNIGFLTAASDYDTGTSFSIVLDNFVPNAFEAKMYLLSDNTATTALDYELDTGTALSIGSVITVPQGIDVGTYLIEFTKTVDDISMTYGVIFMVNTGNTALGNLSSDEVCVDSDVVFTVDATAVKDNYPGSKYSFNFGDGSPEIEITHNQLLSCSQIVHTFINPTCSAEEQVLNPNSEDDEYFFQVDFKLFNKYLLNDFVYYCDTFLSNGGGTTKWINVNTPPISDFTKPDKVCVNSEIIAIEASTLPEYGTGSSCESSYVSRWEFYPPYYSGFEEVLSTTAGSIYEGWITVNPDSGQSILTVPEAYTSVPGCYKLRLTTNTTSGCDQFSIIEKTIIVEPNPEPDFTYTPPTSLCIPVTIDFINTSNTENINPPSCGDPIYTWSVEPLSGTPATTEGFTLLEAENQTNNSIQFTQAGTYNVSLKLENSCGIETTTQQITVISDPTVSFSPDSNQFCQESPAGYTLDFSDTSIAPTYSEAPFTPTSYLWEVFESDGVTISNDYNYVNGTSASSEYPQIDFSEFGVYKIKVTVSGNCGNQSSDVFEFTLKQSPILTNTELNQQICSEEDTEEIIFTSDMSNTTYVWEATTSDPITGFPVGEQTTGSIPVMTLQNSCNVTGNVTIQVIPEVNGCSGDPIDFTITVDPKPQIENKAPAAICSGEEFTFVPVNSCTTGGDIVPENTTYTWSVTQITGTVSGLDSDDSGTGSVSGTITNTSSTFAIIEYTVIPTTPNGCLGDDFTVTVTVNPEPVVTNQTITVCSDENLNQAFNASTSVAAGTYNVTNLQTNGLSISAGNPAVVDGLLANDLEDDAFTNLTNAPVDVIYTVVPVSGSNCEGDPFTVTVTVNPEPVVADQTTTVCSDEILGFTLENDLNGPDVTSYNLTSIVDNGLIPASGNIVIQNGLLSDAISNDSWNNITGTAQDVVYTFIPVGDNGCLGDPFTVTVTVNPEPVVTNQTTTVCSDEALGYILANDIDTPNVASYNLTSIVDNGLIPASGNIVIQNGLLSDAISNDSWNNITSAALDVIYTFVPVGDNGCLGDDFTVTVTVNPEPVVTNQTITVCSDENLNQAFNASTSVAADTYNVTNLQTNGLSISAGNPAVENGLLANDLEDDAFTNLTNAPVDVIYTVVPVSGSNCEGDPFTVTVTVNPEPVVADQTTTVCSDEILGFTLENDLNGPDVASYNLTNITSNGLTAASGNTTVQNALSSDAISNDSWNNITGTAQDVVYTFIPVGDNGCLGDPFTVTVTVNPEPVVTNQTTTVCSDEALGYILANDIDTPNVASYNLTSIVDNGLIPASGNIVIQNGLLSDAISNDSWNNITSAALDVIYTFVPVGDNGCLGDDFTVTVTVNPEPVVTNQTITVCSDENLNQAFNASTSVAADTYNVTNLQTNGLSISAGNPAVENGLLANDLEDDAFTNLTNAPVDVIYTVVPVSGSNCEGDPFTVTVTVNPEPVVADQTTTVCSDEILGFTLENDLNGPDVASYNLTNITSNGLTAASGNTTVQNALSSDAISNDSWNNITGTAQDVVYTFIPVGDNGCLGDPFTVTVTVNPEPVVTNQTTTVCSDEALGYILANDIDTPNVASYNLTSIVDNGLIPASGNIVIQNGLLSDAISNDSWNNITSAALDVIYTFVPVGDNGCLGDDFTVTVTVNPEPVVTNQTITVCSDENLNQAFNASTSVAADTYNVTNLQTNGLSISAGNPAVENGLLANDLEDDAFTNLTNAPVDVIYTVVPVSGSNCEGDPFTVTVTVNPEPVVADQTTTVCSDEILGFTLENDLNGPDVASYNLTNITSNGLTAASGNTTVQNALSSDAISNDSWNNITGTAQDVVYTFIPVGDNGCLGDPFTVTVTVNPEPVGIDSNETISSDVAFDFNPQDNITPGGNAVTSNFTWVITQITGTVSGVNLGDTGSQNVTGTITNTNANTAIVEYTITPTSENGCLGTPFKINVSITSEPVVSNQTITVCSDENLNQAFNASTSVAAGTYNITNLQTNGLSISAGNPAVENGLLANDLEDDAFTNLTNAPVDVIYTVVPVSNDNTVGDPFTVTVTVNPEPVVADQTTTVCSDEILGFTLENDLNGPDVASYNLTNITSNGLTAASGNTTVQNALSSDAISNDSWNNITGTAQDVVYTFIPVGDNGCLGDPFTVTVTVNPEPVGIDSNETISSDVAFDFNPQDNITPGGNAVTSNFTWVITQITGTVSGVNLGDTGSQNVTGTITNTNANTAIVEYTITPTSENGCLGTPFKINVSITSEPVVSNQTITVCSDENLNQAFNASTSVAAGTYNITNLQTNGLSISAGNPAVENGLLANDLEDDAFTNLTNAPVDVIYTVVPVSNDNTVGDPFTVTVTVNPEPVVADQTTTVCSDEILGFTLENDLNGPDVASYNLTNITSNGLTAASGNTTVQNALSSDAISNDSWNNITGTAQDVVYTFIPVGDNGCLGDPFTVTVTIDTEPVGIDSNETISSDVAFDFNPQDNITPGGNAVTSNFTWVITQITGTVSGVNLGDTGIQNVIGTITNTEAGIVTVEYTITPTSENGCLGTPFKITLTIAPEPVVDDQTITVCSDENLNQAFNASTSVAADTYNVTNLQTNGLSISAGNPAVENGLLANDLEDDAFTNLTNAPVDVIYTVVPVSNDNTVGDPFTVTVTVNPEPVVADQTTTVCSDEILGFTLENDLNGPDVASYNLTNITSNGLTAASGNTTVQNALSSDAISNDSWNNITGTAQDVVYTFIPVGDNGCLGDPFTVTVTVNPEPVVTNQTTTVCSDEALGYILANDIDTPNVASYNLTSIVDNGLIPASGNIVIQNGLLSDAISNDSWNNITSAALDVIYTFVPVGDNGCLGDDFTVTVTVNPEPVVTNQTITVCSDENLNQAFNASTSVAADTYNVTNLQTNGLSISAGNPAVENGLLANDLEDDAFTNLTNAPVDVIYTVVPVSGSNCEGDPFTVTVTVNPEPVVADQTTTVCSDEILGFTLENDLNGPDVASYNLTNITSNGLTAASGNTTVQNALSSDAISNDSWNNITGTAQDVVYTFIPVGDNGCLGDPFTVTVTVNPEPVGIDSNETVCSDGSFNFNPQDNITPGGNAVTSNFTWEITQITGTVSGVNLGDTGSQNVTGTITNTNANTAIVEYTITPTSENGCLGTPFKINVSITSEPVVSNQTITVCSDENLNQAFNASTSVAAGTYNVTNLQTNGLSISAGNPAVVDGLLANDLEDDAFTNLTNAPVDVIYTVVPVSGSNCEGDPFTVTVTVNPEPVVADQTTTVCSDEILGFTLENDLNGPDVTSYNLTSIVDNGLIPASGNIVIQNGLLSDAISNDSWNNITGTAQDVVYTFIPVGDNGCLGDPFTVTVTIDTEPVGSDSNETVCSDGSFNFNPQDNITPGGNAVTSNFTWEITQITGTVSGVNVGDTGIQNVTGTITNTNANTAIVEYTITPTSENGCLGTPFKINVSITSEPVVSNQTITVCSDENLNQAFNASTSVAADTYNVTNLQTNGLSISAGNPAVANGLLANDLEDDAFTNLTNAPVDLIYTVVPVSGSNCEGDPFTVTVTVNPSGKVDAISSQEICESESVQAVTFNTTNTNGTTSYSWSMDTAIGLSPLTGVDNFPSFIAVNSTNTPIVSIVTVTPTYSSGGITCEGTPETFSIKVNPTPQIQDKFKEICSSETFIVDPVDMVDGDIVPLGTTYTWTVLVSNSQIPDASNGSGAVISQTLTNMSNSVQNVSYEVTPTSGIAGNCSGTPFEIVISVAPSPQLQDQQFEICSGESFSFLPVNDPPTTIIPDGTLYSWTFGNNINVFGAIDGLNQIQFEQPTLINNSNINQSVIYTVNVGAGNCASSFEIEIIVKPTPFIPYNSGLTDTRCSNDPFVIDPVNGIPDATYIVPTNTTYTWVVVPNNNLSGWSDNNVQTNLISQQLVNLTNTPQNIEYLITPSNGTCEGPLFSVDIWIEPKPSIPDHFETVCDGDSFVFAPVNGVFPDTTTIVPDTTLYSWVVTDVSGGDISGYSNGIDQPFIDSGALFNSSPAIQTLIYEVTPSYYKSSNPGVAQCIGESFSITVSVNPNIEDNATITNISCSYSPLCGGSIELNPVGIGTLTYFWTYTGTEINAISNPTLQDQYNLCPGNYSVAITDSLGCTYSFDYEIVPPLPVTFNLLSLVDLSCNNVSPSCDGSIEVIPQGGTAPYTLLEWYTESIPDSGNFDTIVETGDSELNNACEGNYVLKVLDTNGCEFTSPIYTIAQTSSPILISETLSNYNGYEVSCLGANDGFIDVSVSGGSGSFTYTLSPGGILDSDLSTPNILEFRNLQAGNYTLTITDTNCPNDITFDFTLEAPTQLSTSNTLVSGPALCFGDTVTYNIAATGGTPPYVGTGNYTLPAGIHSIVVTDANGCQTTETITVIEPTELTGTASITSPILCYGDLAEVTVTASGGTPPYVGTGVFNTTSGDYIYTITDANGCEYSNNIFINEPGELLYTIDSVVDPTCSPDWSYSNGSICITITGGTNPFPIGTGWTSLGGGVWCLENISAGTYTIDVDDANNCSTNTNSTEVILTRPPVIEAQITSTLTADCENNTMIQTNYVFVTGGSPPYEFSWSDGDVCDPLNPQCMETTESGTYTAFIHDQESLANGCPPIEVEVIIDLPEIGDAAFSYSSPNSVFCNQLMNNELITFNNESTGDVVNFYWDFGDGSPVVVGEMTPTHLYAMAGSYEVSLTVEYPSECCTETYTELIEITKGYELEIPNAFTPNQDGINDTIRPLFDCMDNVQMSIYDTWGTLLYFEEGTSLVGWDGFIRNIPAENGNYILYVKALTNSGKEITKSTSITLIK